MKKHKKFIHISCIKQINGPFRPVYLFGGEGGMTPHLPVLRPTGRALRVRRRSRRRTSNPLCALSRARVFEYASLSIFIKRPKGSLYEYGGEGGIRTPGWFPINGFQDRRFRPLSHLSVNYVNFISCRRLRRRPSTV